MKLYIDGITEYTITNLIQYVGYGGEFKDWVANISKTVPLTQEDINRIIKYIDVNHGIDILNYSIDPTRPMDIVRSLVGTVKDVYKGVIEGDSMISDKDLYTQRMAICRGCPFFDDIETRCTKCSCKLKYKTKLKRGKCPVGKW